MLAWQGVHHPPCWVWTVLLHCPNLALILYVAQPDVDMTLNSHSQGTTVVTTALKTGAMNCLGLGDDCSLILDRFDRPVQP